MQRTLIFTLSLVVVLFGAIVMAQEKPWFDLKNCEFCKQIDKEPGLLDHMTTEYHDLSDGILSITHIDKGYEDAFKHALAGMKGIVADIAAGKMPVMCQHCSMLGQFYTMGVKQEQVSTGYGIVVLYESTDSAMISNLWKFGKRSAEESAKIKQERAATKAGKDR